MKKAIFLSLILICIAAVSLIIFTAINCDDEDSAPDLVYNTNDPFQFDKLFVNILSFAGIFYGHQDIIISPKSFLAYLEEHEKSPPLSPAFS